ncbi:MEKHLA domain-containing protein [Paenibacillus koleovorans]|uniref:MEKHLA domain-containing protein n=1 Tax=Paenibacillus koleovorans TaxID=121608 RepID=UPI001FE90103|nr:MEKHLA domain-containing protein [Paenibacillus koleovorans]
MALGLPGIGATERHAERICRSYEHWTGKDLLAGEWAGVQVETGVKAEKAAGEVSGAMLGPVSVPETSDSLADKLFHSSIVVLSHGLEPDPILNYGNAAALELWEMDWATFTQTPSRLTAEPLGREARERFMQQVRRDGYVAEYTGIRVSATGRRFYIVDALVWNLLDEDGAPYGQAAAFAKTRDV